MCACIIVQRCALFTDVYYSECMKARRKTACSADHCVMEYLPSSDCSQLSERLVHLHLHCASPSAAATSVYDVFSVLVTSEGIFNDNN